MRVRGGAGFRDRGAQGGQGEELDHADGLGEGRLVLDAVRARVTAAPGCRRRPPRSPRPPPTIERETSGAEPRSDTRTTTPRGQRGGPQSRRTRAVPGVVLGIFRARRRVEGRPRAVRTRRGVHSAATMIPSEPPPFGAERRKSRRPNPGPGRRPSRRYGPSEGSSEGGDRSPGAHRSLRGAHRPLARSHTARRTHQNFSDLRKSFSCRRRNWGNSAAWAPQSTSRAGGINPTRWPRSRRLRTHSWRMTTSSSRTRAGCPSPSARRWAGRTKPRTGSGRGGEEGEGVVGGGRDGGRVRSVAQATGSGRERGRGEDGPEAPRAGGRRRGRTRGISGDPGRRRAVLQQGRRRTGGSEQHPRVRAPEGEDIAPVARRRAQGHGVVHHTRGETRAGGGRHPQVDQRQESAMSVQELSKDVAYTQSIETGWKAPAHIRKLTEEERDDVRNKWHIIVEGVDIPPPIKTFRR